MSDASECAACVRTSSCDRARTVPGANAMAPVGDTPLPIRQRGHVTSYGVGRVCAQPGCDTALSRYNGANVCSYHHELALAVEHGRRP